jgi:hypothetical protein
MLGAAARKLEAGSLMERNHPFIPPSATSSCENLPLGRSNGDKLTKKWESLVIKVSKKPITNRQTSNRTTGSLIQSKEQPPTEGLLYVRD